MLHKKYTPYDDVNEVLHLLLINVKQILEEQFFGMYLYGSLSSGDFNPESSDVDFLVVATDYLSEKTISELEAMHKQTWATSLKRAGKLEGAYIPKELIRKHNPNAFPVPTINEGKFYLDTPGSDWVIQRHVVREFGVVLEGADPKTFIDFVSPEDIRNCVMGVLHEWWFPMLDDSTWLKEKEDGDRAFGVITMCRVLHALEHGTIVSKPKAIEWARTQLDSHWNQLINKAVAISNHEEENIFLDETLDFIKYVKERIEGKSK
jgi:predicted nucleotidyltransferase